MPTSHFAARGDRFWQRFQAGRPLNSVTLFLQILLLFTVATAIFFWQWMPYLTSALIGPPEDNLQDYWNTWYAAIARNPDHFFFTDLIRFPEGTPLYYHSFAYPKIFTIALLSKILSTETSTLIMLHNLCLLISFPLAGIGTFYLARHLTSNTIGSLLGGFIFAFNPSHVEQVMHHAHVSSIEFIPFFVFTYILALERKSLLFLFLAIAFYALNALSCWYYLFYIAYFIAFHTLYIAIRDHAAPRGWQLLTPVACLVGVSVVLSPILVPMVRTAMGGASVYAEGADVYVADLFAYLAFPRSHILAPLADGIYRRVTGNQWEGNNQWEATVYLGVVNVVVLAWLCVTARRDESRLLTYLLCGIAVFCVFASGDSLHILGHRTIPMPAMALSQLPFFGNVRTPSRAIVFVYMFMAIGIAQAAALGWRSWQQPIARWGIAAVAALIILDFFPARRLPMMPVACPPGLAAIRDDSEKGFGVLDLPGGYHENNFYMMYQICHSRPIAQGVTSRSNVVVSLRDRLESRDFQAQQRQLAAAKIKYIVIHHPSIFHPSTNRRMSFFRWRAVDGPKEQYLRAYPTVYDGPDLTLLKVY